jgi:hypothetical protein
MERRLLSIYLNDHLAGATAGLELARRARGANEGTELGRFLARLSAEIAADRRTLEWLIDELGIRRDRVKAIAAWGAEKVGRLKLNGQLIGYSPLSRLVELELLQVGITGKLLMWQALERRFAEPPGGLNLRELIERAEGQRSEVERYRLQAAAGADDRAEGDAVGPPSRRSGAPSRTARRRRRRDRR